MLKSTLLAAAAASFLSTGAAAAHDFTLGPIRIDHPWARASAGAVRVGAAYMTLRNGGTSGDRLLMAATPQAARVELHSHVMKDGTAMMQEVKAIDINAAGTAELKPGGLHVMLFDLKAPLREGESFPLTLTFERAGTVTVQVKVEKRGAMQGEHGGADRGKPDHGKTH